MLASLFARLAPIAPRSGRTAGFPRIAPDGACASSRPGSLRSLGAKGFFKELAPVLAEHEGPQFFGLPSLDGEDHVGEEGKRVIQIVAGGIGGVVGMRVIEAEEREPAPARFRLGSSIVGWRDDESAMAFVSDGWGESAEV